MHDWKNEMREDGWRMNRPRIICSMSLINYESCDAK